MKIEVKKNTRKKGPLHFGEITGAESGQIYTFGIFNGGQCDRSVTVQGKARTITMSGGKKVKTKPKPRKVYVDSTGWVCDQGAEWWIKFDQPELPDVYCRSDHKLAKRMALVIVAAYEAGLHK